METKSMKKLKEWQLEGKITVKGSQQGPKNQKKQKKNKKECCPGCGYRKRFPEHPLCPSCNKIYINETAEAAAEGEEMPISRMEWAIKKGEKTLSRLQEELKEARKKESQKQQPYWDQAHKRIQENLGGKRIDKKAYHKAVGKQFKKLWKGSSESKISRKVYGLKKAIESLKKFLKESKK